MPRYAIEHEDLVQLLALVCAHGILGERQAVGEADEALGRSNEILERAGVEDVTELNEEVGAALAEMLPEDRWPGEEPDGSATTPVDIQTELDDPYLWGSGT